MNSLENIMGFIADEAAEDYIRECVDCKTCGRLVHRMVMDLEGCPHCRAGEQPSEPFTFNG